MSKKTVEADANSILNNFRNVLKIRKSLRRNDLPVFCMIYEEIPDQDNLGWRRMEPNDLGSFANWEQVEANAQSFDDATSTKIFNICKAAERTCDAKSGKQPKSVLELGVHER